MTKKRSAKTSGGKRILFIVLAVIFVAAMIKGLVGGSDKKESGSYVSRNSPQETASTAVPAQATQALLTTAVPTDAPTASPAPTELPTPEATPTPKPTPEAAPTTQPTQEPTEPPTQEPTNEPTGTHYVLNSNTHKFHHPECSSVDQIQPGNRIDFYGTREEVIAKGYEPCKLCKP